MATDVNQDGRIDLIFSLDTQGPIAIFPGNGDGTFSPVPAATYVMGNGAAGVVLADLNNDGTKDLVAADSGLNSVSTRLGIGGGHFGMEKRFQAGAIPFAPAIADFNLDGKQDLVVANGATQDLSIFFGRGDGTFDPQTRFALGTAPSAPLVGDIDGDGDVDILVPTCAGYGASSSAALLVGGGDGTFAVQPTIAGHYCLVSAALEDVDSDGKLDLLAGVSPNRTYLWLGQSGGVFSTAKELPIPSGPQSPKSGDLTGDGIPDIVSLWDYTGAYLLAGLGGGNFATESIRLPMGGYFYSDFAISDFDGDGRDDLAVADTGSSGIGVILNSPTGLVTAALHPTGDHPLSIGIDDFNADGNLDLAVPNDFSDDISIYLGDGNGSFGAPTSVPGVDGARRIAISDFNGDDVADLAVSGNGDMVSILLGHDDGTFDVPISVATGHNPYPIVAADFNNDGKNDLAAGNTGPFESDVSILLGRGDGTFDPETRFGIGEIASSLEVGDVNDDGLLDLVSANRSSDDVSLLLGNGDGTFAPEIRFPSPDELPEWAVLADVNNNGKADLVMLVSIGKLEVRLGNGDGTFGSWKSFETGGRPGGRLVLRDFDGDGKLDAAAGAGGGDVFLMLGKGDGTFTRANYFGMGVGPAYLEGADLNHDSKVDLLAVADSATFGDKGLSVLLNRGAGDADKDGIPNPLDTCTDTDGDGFGDPDFPASTCPIDLCPELSNSALADSDADGWGDPCDNCPNVTNPRQEDYDADGIGDVCDTCTDSDGDGFGDFYFSANACDSDNCPYTYNSMQFDSDFDGAGNACDNCQSVSNYDQRDSDHDGLGDSCDPCPQNAIHVDADGDGYPACSGDCDDTDPRRSPGNPELCDGIDNDCDNQTDEIFPDGDFDTIPNCRDDCPLVWNSTQVDSDGNGIGDSCEPPVLFGRANLSKEGFSADRIDGRDLEVFTESYGTCPGDPQFNPVANLDQVPGGYGGCVGATDFHLFMDQFGRAQ